MKMADHPIEGLMLTAMNSIKDMIDVNTIIGKPIQASNEIVVIPISKVSFGFAAGGSEFKGETICLAPVVKLLGCLQGFLYSCKCVCDCQALRAIICHIRCQLIRRIL